MSGWLASPTDQGSEVAPVNDIVGHEAGEECPCIPGVEFIPSDDGDRWMVIHNAWDGRE